LFKPFDTTKGYSGMGIGAYQAREIIRALGGDIVVRSAVGEGTTVLISLPVTGAGKAGRPLAEVAG
jgi:signal transduction histidine kinase